MQHGLQIANGLTILLYWCRKAIAIQVAGANYIQGGDADVPYLASSFSVSPTCRTDAGSGPPPPNVLTF